VSHASPASSTTGLYLHDLDDHIIAETDTSGNTLREYIWLGDTPLAVVDNVPTIPAIFYVHTDHLMRPLLMTDASAALAWSVAYEPFGTVASVNAVSSNIDLRFPGQWFQLESGLHYNWHRHYDASLGRYLQPDPLLVDEGRRKILGGINLDALFTQGEALNTLAALQGVNSRVTRSSLPEAEQEGFYPRPRTILPNGPSTYGYSGQSPLVKNDPTGLVNFSPIVGGQSQREAAQMCQPAAAELCGFNGAVKMGSSTLCQYICTNNVVRVLNIRSLPSSLCPPQIANY
jgi:RHS repeat-associated protein